MSGRTTQIVLLAGQVSDGQGGDDRAVGRLVASMPQRHAGPVQLRQFRLQPLDDSRLGRPALVRGQDVIQPVVSQRVGPHVRVSAAAALGDSAVQHPFVRLLRVPIVAADEPARSQHRRMPIPRLGAQRFLEDGAEGNIRPEQLADVPDRAAEASVAGGTEHQPRMGWKQVQPVVQDGRQILRRCRRCAGEQNHCRESAHSHPHSI